MAIGNVLRSMTVVAAVALSACSGNASSEATDSTAADPETVSTSSPAPTATTQPGSIQTGEVPLSETLDPAGSIVGGRVDRSYVDLAYPTELTGIIGLAVTDLAGRLGVGEPTVTVVLVEEVVWSDASHGCPQPGMSYAQVLTDGLRIVLEGNGVLYDYRSGGTSDPELCVQARDQDSTRAGIFELTEEGEIIFVPAPGKEAGTPTEGLNPPDK